MAGVSGSGAELGELLAQANGCLARQQLAEATPLLNLALKIAPEHPAVIAAVGGLYLLARQFEQACDWLQKAVTLQPDDAANRINLAQALTLLGSHEAAIAHLEAALPLDPQNIKLHFALGRALMEIGKIAEAIAHFEQAIALNPDYGLVYHLLSQIKKFSVDDIAFIEMAEAALTRDLRPVDRCALHFALGKMHDDIGHPAQAFPHFEMGNQLLQFDVDYSINMDHVRNQQAACTARALKKKHSRNESAKPVFVVGMPRSGTTLVEQIISSHPLAAGAGELREIARLSGVLFSQAKRPLLPGLPAPVPSLDLLDRCAEEYLSVLAEGRESSQRIVDKMPENYHWLGAIALLFPAAKIIHISRHPLDTCLSCYFQMFTEIRWASDLDEIAAVYRNYRNTMNHWRKVLPPGMLVEIRYEDLVADSEKYSRQLIAECGLEWDARCLEFFRTERKVSTASVWQVRQPIYQSSRKRWLNYQSFIGALVSSLREYLDEDDVKLLGNSEVLT